MNRDNARKQRLIELEEILARREKLSDSEYLELLHEVRKNYTVKLAMLSVRMENKDTGGTVNVIDKVHWLIDNMESKDIEKTEEDKYEVNVFFRSSDTKG